MAPTIFFIFSEFFWLKKYIPQNAFALTFLTHINLAIGGVSRQKHTFTTFNFLTVENKFEFLYFVTTWTSHKKCLLKLLKLKLKLHLPFEPLYYILCFTYSKVASINTRY